MIERTLVGCSIKIASPPDDGVTVTRGRLSVLRVAHRLPPFLGGQEIHVAELTRHLAMQGVQQTLLCAKGDLSLTGVEIKRISLPSRLGTIARDTALGAQLAAIHKGNRFDVVHTHGDAPVARGGTVAATRLGAIHVHTFHGGLTTGGVRGRLLKAMLPSGSWYLAVSEKVAGTLLRGGADPDHIFIRPSGVRDPFIEGRSAPRRSGAAIGGRLTPEKGVLQFVSAWTRMSSETELSVFGAGEEALAIERVAGQARGVKWVGELNGGQLSELLLRTSVGAVMSVQGVKSMEGTPTIALEMLAAGCFPIVDAAAGEAPTLVSRFGFGSVADAPLHPGMVAAMAEASSAPHYDRIREVTRRQMARYYGWATIATAVRQFYLGLLDNDPHPGSALSQLQSFDEIA